MKGLGQRVKELRKARRLRLVEMAKKTGIDQATLSRIENGKMTGTLQSHLKIAEALGVPLPNLYSEVLEKVHKEKDRATQQKIEAFFHSSGAVAELLTTNILQKKMMPVVLKLKGRGHTETEELPALTERFAYALKGNIEIITDKERRLLKAGESFYFDASVPHYFRNPLKKESWCLSVITPASL